jgi:hypothetical protein
LPSSRGGVALPSSPDIDSVVIVRRCVVHSRVVEPVIPCSTPTSPPRSRLQSKVVVDPCVIKESQASGEDEASKRSVHQVRDKKLEHPARLKFDSSELFSRGKDLQQLTTEEKKAPG